MLSIPPRWNMQWIVPCFFLFVIDFVAANDRCRTEVNIRGMALKGFVFKKMTVTAPHMCDVKCEREITCQSYNYVRKENLCELNNRTKAARPENFRSDPARFYIRRLNGRAPLGSIRELPAQSCQEIKASEGKDTISNKYWLDPTGNGMAVLVYCDMILKDIDECITGNHDCDVNANCTNTIGSHNCTCKEGFTGDGRLCSDIDECSNGSHKCDVNANCTNTIGSYNCTCNKGFSGDGHLCSDIDECSNGSHTCDANANCTNTIGSHYCTCNKGFTGDGHVCSDKTRSCKEVFEIFRFQENKAYPLLIDDEVVPVYCHMTTAGIGACGDGQWTVVMKINGTKNTFGYNSPLWSDKNTFNLPGGSTGFDFEETKLPTYWNTPFTKICLGMKFEQQDRFVVINQTANSLYSLIADGQYRATSLERNTWKNQLVGPKASLEPYCDKEGFNVVCFTTDENKVRIGIVGNDQNDCLSCLSFIGFGGYQYGAKPCGNDASAWSDNGEKIIRAMGYILIQ